MPNKLQIKFIKDAMENAYLLSAWEVDFIYNIADIADDRELSDKQNAILNRIITKINRERR